MCIKPGLTQRAIYQLLRREPYINSDLATICNLPLQELGTPAMEVNWVLNLVEGEYQIELAEGPISLQTPLDEFKRQLLQAGKAQLICA